MGMRWFPLLVAMLCAPLWGDDLVFDDAELSRSFAEKLGRLAESRRPLDGKMAVEQLTATLGKSVEIPAVPPAGDRVPAPSVYERTLPSVVAVGSVYKCGKCDKWHLGGFATGWTVSPDGLVVTNYHVLAKDDGNKIGVMTSSGEVYAATEVLAANKDGDAAVFRIDVRGQRLPSLALGESPRPGDRVEVVSHPKGRFFCLTEGVVSRFHRQKNRGNGKAVWMSVTADYAVGSSGGPVFDEKGAVVGMVSSTLTAQASENAKDKQGGNVQMVFKDCVSLGTLRDLIRTPDRPAGKP